MFRSEAAKQKKMKRDIEREVKKLVEKAKENKGRNTHHGRVTLLSLHLNRDVRIIQLCRSMSGTEGVCEASRPAF